MREFLFDCVCFVKGKFLFKKECICIALQHNAIANEFLDIYFEKRRCLNRSCAVDNEFFLLFLDFLCVFLQF